jgi:serine/threonine protein kinase
MRSERTGEVSPAKDVNNDKIFARKIIRLFGEVTEEDIENEAGAVSALCTAGHSKYVVEVLKHGWLTKDHAFYFIDMEYCIQTLDDFIRGIAKESQNMQPAEMQTEVPGVQAITDWDALNNDFSDSSVRSVPPPTDNAPTSSAMELDIDQQSSPAPMESTQRLPDSEPVPSISSPPMFPEDALIDWEELISILDDITSGLIYIHSQKFVHRDLKPRNGKI